MLVNWEKTQKCFIIKATSGSYRVQQVCFPRQFHKSYTAFLPYVKPLSTYPYIHSCTYYAHILEMSVSVNTKTSFEPTHCINHFLSFSALEIMLANLHSQSAIYRGFRSLDTAVLFVIECLNLLQTRIWAHPMFAFSFSWSLLNRLSDMPD